MKTEILYRCEDYVVVRKPFGYLSEASQDCGEKTCPAEIISQLDADNVKFEGIFVVHRLDRGTSGVMIYALNSRAAAEISEIIRRGGLKKIYCALVTDLPDGWFERQSDNDNQEFANTDRSLLKMSGEMHDELFFDRKRNKSFVIKDGKRRAGVKSASLRYRILGQMSKDSLHGAYEIEIELETGRTHQIRVQFGSRKAPLLGDGKYGSKINYKGCALCSVRLSFMWRGEEKIYDTVADWRRELV